MFVYTKLYIMLAIDKTMKNAYL